MSCTYSTQALKAAEEHLQAVALERTYYHSICKSSRDVLVQQYTTEGNFILPPLGIIVRPVAPGKTIHFSFDMVQQVLLMQRL